MRRQTTFGENVEHSTLISASRISYYSVHCNRRFLAHEYKVLRSLIFNIFRYSTVYVFVMLKNPGVNNVCHHRIKTYNIENGNMSSVSFYELYCTVYITVSCDWWWLSGRSAGEKWPNLKSNHDAYVNYVLCPLVVVAVASFLSRL